MKEILVLKAKIEEKEDGYLMKFQTELTRLAHILKDEEVEKISKLTREIGNIFSSAVKRNIEESSKDKLEERLEESKEDLLSSMPLDIQKELREFERKMEEEKDPIKRLDILFKQILKDLNE